MNVFVTGTDTNVGKTIVSAWICSNVKTKYWKLVQTGSDSDSFTVRRFVKNCEIIPSLYTLRTPLSVYDAAKIERIEIDIGKFNTRFDKIVIEGAGGVLVPIAHDFLMIDAIKYTNSAALVVVRSKLGMINHVLLTINALKSRQIRIIGIIVVGSIEKNIKETIESFSGTKILSVLPETDDLEKLFATTPLPNEILEILK